MPDGHYFEAEPTVASRRREVELVLADATVTLSVDRGVFSGTRIDPGTLALLRAMPAPPAAGHLLDLGCGYGPIAVTLARRSPSAVVWAVDINRRALDLVDDSAAHLGLTNVRAATPDAVDPGITFTGIWSNPPIRVGKEALHSLLGTWLPRLEPEGKGWLVVHRHLGADSLMAWLGREGWVVNRLASKQGYRILEIAWGQAA